MELSSYQKDIIEYFENNPHENIIVKALAGTGKSTLLKLLTQKTKTSDIYVAFNATIAEEFREKITNPKTKVSTLHSLAFSIMNYNLQNSVDTSRSRGIGTRNSSTSGANLDNLKIHKIVDEIINEFNGRYYDFEKRIFLKDNYVQLYNLCRLTRTDMTDEDEVTALVNEYRLFLDYSENNFTAPIISTILVWLDEIDTRSSALFNTDRTIDFTDMLYITHEKLKTKKWEIPYWALYTNILVDEAQDLCNLHMALLKYIKRNGGRYVFVMDENQAIYAFSGSNARACRLIPSAFAPIKEFPLPINYRCPSSHLKRVNERFNIPIVPRDDAPKGTIKTIDKKDIIKYVKNGDMVISRKNKWLSDVILSLAKAGIPVYMEDKESVENIKSTITKQKATNLYQLKKNLQKVVDNYQKSLEEISKSSKKSNKKKMLEDECEAVRQINEELEREVDAKGSTAINSEINENDNANVVEESDTDKMIKITSTNSKIDNVNFVLSILQNYSSSPKHKYSTPKDFLSYTSNLLNTTSPKDCVRICSVHKAKGLEAPNVFVLNEARICTDPRNSWEQNKQESNLSYIAITRAMDTLYLVRELED